MKAPSLIALVATGFLVSCVSIISSPKTRLELVLSSEFTNTDSGKRHIIKVTPELRKHCGDLKKGQYAMWGDSCEFGGNPPNALKLEYAIIPLTKNEIHSAPKERNDIIVARSQSLPQSAWRTYTINPKQLLEKGQAMPVYVGFPNEPYAKNDPKRFNYGTRVTVTLYVDGNGNISQEIVHKPISRDRFQ